VYPKFSHSFCANPTGSLEGNLGVRLPQIYPRGFATGGSRRVYTPISRLVTHAIETMSRTVIIRHRSARVGWQYVDTKHFCYTLQFTTKPKRNRSQLCNNL